MAEKRQFVLLAQFSLHTLHGKVINSLHIALQCKSLYYTESPMTPTSALQIIVGTGCLGVLRKFEWPQHYLFVIQLSVHPAVQIKMFSHALPNKHQTKTIHHAELTYMLTYMLCDWQGLLVALLCLHGEISVTMQGGSMHKLQCC